jgi:hypothetical protein
MWCVTWQWTGDEIRHLTRTSRQSAGYVKRGVELMTARDGRVFAVPPSIARCGL